MRIKPSHPARLALLLSLIMGIAGLACIGSVDAPTLTYPAEDAVVSGSQVTFSWSEVDGATHYRIEISSDSMFSGTAVSEDSVAGTSYAVDLEFQTSPLDGQTTYYWHAAAFKDMWGPWSETRSFFNDNPKRP